MSTYVTGYDDYMVMTDDTIRVQFDFVSADDNGADGAYGGPPGLPPSGTPGSPGESTGSQLDGSLSIGDFTVNANSNVSGETALEFQSTAGPGVEGGPGDFGGR